MKHRLPRKLKKKIKKAGWNFQHFMFENHYFEPSDDQAVYLQHYEQV